MRFFSRRKFIQGAAAGTVALSLGWNGLDQRDLAFRVRALRFAPVYIAPGGALAGHLPADSVLTVRAVGQYFSSEHGFIAQTDMQPMLEIVPVPFQGRQPPFMVEVLAPSLPLRAYAASEAETVRHVGHGALLSIIGTLPGRTGELWYETADHAWVAAHGLSLWTPPTHTVPFAIEVDQRHGVLTAFLNNQPYLRTPFAYARPDPDARQIVTGEWVIQGAHTHNQFILDQNAAASVIDIPVGAARALQVGRDAILGVH
jgi:hypothetical protein